jgi:hypothetical protein
VVTSTDYDFIYAVVAIVFGTPVTFYITKYLEDRSQFNQFKKKLDSIAGVGSKILWPGTGGPPGSLQQGTKDIYTVLEISREGLVLQNDMHKLFVPIQKVLDSEIVRPAENIEQLRRDDMRKTMTDVINAMIPATIEKLKEVLVKELLSPDTELSAVVGVQILGQLKDAGVDTSKIELERPSLGRILAEVKEGQKNKAISDSPPSTPAGPTTSPPP